MRFSVLFAIALCAVVAVAAPGKTTPKTKGRKREVRDEKALDHPGFAGLPGEPAFEN